jgi:hypothetical protein
MDVRSLTAGLLFTPTPHPHVSPARARNRTHSSYRASTNPRNSGPLLRFPIRLNARLLNETCSKTHTKTTHLLYRYYPRRQSQYRGSAMPVAAGASSIMHGVRALHATWRRIWIEDCALWGLHCPLGRKCHWAGEREGPWWVHWAGGLGCDRGTKGSQPFCLVSSHCRRVVSCRVISCLGPSLPVRY